VRTGANKCNGREERGEIIYITRQDVTWCGEVCSANKVLLRGLDGRVLPNMDISCVFYLAQARYSRQISPLVMGEKKIQIKSRGLSHRVHYLIYAKCLNNNITSHNLLKTQCKYCGRGIVLAEPSVVVT
jgi:hypothetical protein